MNYEQACTFLESLGKLDTPFEYMKERKTEDLEKYLFRMQELLDRLGNPEFDMKYIHVTGTAGKGTTTALVHNMLHASGCKVGSTSSPAVTATIERIKVGDLYISPESFAEIVVGIKPVILDMYMTSPYGKPSYFDIMLAIALMYFKQQKCEWVVLEVGMGGRYDSTNVVQDVYASLITNIGMDHMHLLGDNLTDIAYEKAGIIKENSQLFTTEQNQEILLMFEKMCKEKNSSFTPVEGSTNPNESLLRALGQDLGISKEHIDVAIKTTTLPCRFEIFGNNPLVVLDGAHNVSKVEYSLQKLADVEYKKLHVLFGCLNTKDAFGMIDVLVRYSQDITLCFFQNKTFSLKDLFTYVTEKYPQVNVQVNFDAHDVLGELIQKVDQDDGILAIGSLYLVGDLRQHWYSEAFILKHRKSF